MESKVNILSDSEHELNVTLGYDEIKNEIDEAYKKERKTISLPGFRKGKVPLSMLKKLYGEAIEYKASEDIANKKFWEIVESEKLKPISTPQLVDIDYKMGEELSFKVKYEVKPVFEVKDYKGLEVEKPVFKVTDEMIEEEVEKLLKQHATFEPAEKVEDKNFKIKVELVRTDENGEPVENAQPSENEIDLSDPRVNKDLVEGALGKKVGDTFPFTFDDEHNHGEEVHKETYYYNVEIKEINKIVLPEQTEEFFKKVTNDKATNMEELKKYFREQYEEYYEKESDSAYTDALLNKIVENNPFDLPKGYAATVLDRLTDSEMERAAQQGYKNLDKNVVRESLKPRADWFAKWQIISENLAAQENISVTDEDLEKLAEEEAKTTGISKDKLINFYKSSKRDDALLEEKLIKFLKENNKAIEVDPEEKAKAEQAETEKKEKKSKKKSTKKEDK